MQLKLLITPAQEGGYIGYVPAIPGAFTQAETIKEVKENIKEAIALLQEVRVEKASKGETNQQVKILLLE